MFIELINCMRGLKYNKYIHMFNYTDFIQYSETNGIKSIDDSLNCMIENEYKIIFSKNKHSDKFPNVFSCTVMTNTDDLYKNFSFAEYDDVIYTLKGIDMNKIQDKYMLENVCLNSLPIGRSFKYLFLKLIKL